MLSKSVVQAAAINGAGDMQFGVAPSTDFKWHIGIEDPNNLNETLVVFQIPSGAIATSGLSKRGEHIAKSGNGEPLLQASIITSSLT